MSDPTSATSKGGSSFGISSVFKSLAKGFKSTPTTLAASAFKPTVVGGASDIQDLMTLVSNETAWASDRIKSAELIRASLETLSISSIPEIWYSARNLTSASQTECRRAGLRLMISCISHDESATGSRLSYYRTIIEHKYLVDFDLQLAALKALTNDGRDLYDLYQSGYPLPKVLTTWLKLISHETDEIRKHKKRDPAVHWGSSMEDNFHELMKFIINTLKFNIAAYTEANLESLIREVVNVCQTTLSIADVALCCELINTIMIYGFIPRTSLISVVEVLCGINATIETLSEKSWEALLNLCRSHLGNSTVLALCRVLDPKSRSGVNANTMRGAAKLLTQLELKFGPSEGGDVMDVPISSIFSAFRQAITVESAKLRCQICSSVYELLTNSDIMKVIGYEVWEITNYSPLEVIYQLCYSSEELKGLFPGASGVPVIPAGLKSPSVSIATTSDRERRIDEYRKIVPKIYGIFNLVEDLLDKSQFKGSVEIAYQFFFDLSLFIEPRTAIRVISYYDGMHFCNPLSTDWSSNTDLLLDNFYYDRHWPEDVRLRTLQVLRDNYFMSLITSSAEVSNELLQKSFLHIDTETSLDVLNALLDIYVDICIDGSHEIFVQLSDILLQMVPDNRSNRNSGAFGRLNPFDQKSSVTDPFVVTRSKLVTRAMTSLFLAVFLKHSRRARYIYFNIVTIAQRSLSMSAVFIEAARLLIRIRCTTTNMIYISHPTNMDGLAASLGRGPQFIRTAENIWWFPENPEDLSHFKPEYLDIHSTILSKSEFYDSIDDPSLTPTGLYTLKENEHDIDIDIWLSLVLDVFEMGGLWEIFSFLWAHFAPQLSNLQLFYSSTGSIQRLRRIMSEQIMSSKIPGSVLLPKEITKLDALVAEVRTMSSLLGYKDTFAKTDADLLVQALVSALSSWEKTAVPCITALTVCCYELSLSVKKNIGAIFTKFQTKITSTQSSPHVLEFLLSLSRLPWLTDNMTQEEYKRIFAMAFNYIQHANDMDRKADSSTKANDRIMSQYLLAIAYNVISNWFLALPVSKRKVLATFITRNLILADGSLENIDEQSMAILDLVSRFTYSNVDLIQQSVPTMISHDGNGKIAAKRWIFGKSLISIETNSITGESQFVVRRPTGTSIVNIAPDSKMLSKQLVDTILGAEIGKSPMVDEDIFSPNYFLLQLVIPNDDRSYLRPIALDEDPATNRGVSALDRAPVVDFHKVGILYIGHGQKTEVEILANQSGSRTYQRFLSKMGRLVKLRENRQIYSGGLDTEMDIDGEFAYVWSDKVTQLIYHTTTMMPPPANPSDTAYASKKRHIGNDYICIFFDESGHVFDFNVISTQFTFINIVITPLTISVDDTFQADSGTVPDGSTEQSGIKPIETKGPVRKKFFKVRAYAKEGIPSVFAAMHLRLVSEENLAVFVRNLSLVASKLATVYQSGGQYISNWRYRLQQINQLTERVIAKQREKEAAEETLNSTSQHKHESAKSGGLNRPDVESSFLDQLAAASTTSAITTTHSSPSITGGGPQDNYVTTNDIPLLKSIDFSSFT